METRKSNHFIRMNVMNGNLEQYGFEATIVAMESEVGGTWKYRAVLTNTDERRFECSFWDGNSDEEFESMPEAIEWLHEKAHKAILGACEHKAWHGRQAQSKIDAISEYGFDL
jgi:hypothetical protein